MTTTAETINKFEVFITKNGGVSFHPLAWIELIVKHNPQDEQDGKDAVRYRKAKKISCNMTVNVSQLDQIIDKAIV